MATVACPHCAAANTAGVAFCATCGKALPSMYATGPRVVTGGAMATTSAGVKLQADELHRQARKASGALLTVAIIQTVVGGILFAVFSSLPGAAGRINIPWLFGPVVAVGAIFWALYFWSRSNPLPAAIVGLVIYVTVWVLDIIGGIVMMSNTPSGGTPSGPGAGLHINPISSGIFIRIIIIVMLVRAIQAGSQHRKLLRQQMAGPLPPLPV